MDVSLVALGQGLGKMLYGLAAYVDVSVPAKTCFVRRKQLHIFSGRNGKGQVFLGIKFVKVKGKK